MTLPPRREGVGDGLVQLVDRGLQRLVQAVAVGRFHHHHVGGRRRRRIAQDRPAAVAEVAREQDPALLAALLQFEQDAGRAEDVAGVEERGADAARQLSALP